MKSTIIGCAELAVLNIRTAFAVGDVVLSGREGNVKFSFLRNGPETTLLTEYEKEHLNKTITQRSNQFSVINQAMIQLAQSLLINTATLLLVQALVVLLINESDA